MNDENTSKKQWIDKLIGFFRRMPQKQQDADHADYSGWHQTEEEYQKEQAEWMAAVEARKKEKKSGRNQS